MGWYVDCNVLGVCTTRVTIRIEGVYAKFPILLLTFIKCAISSRSRSHPNVGQCGCDAAHNITIYQQRAKRSHFRIQGKQLFFFLFLLRIRVCASTCGGIYFCDELFNTGFSWPVEHSRESNSFILIVASIKIFTFSTKSVRSHTNFTVNLSSQ